MKQNRMPSDAELTALKESGLQLDKVEEEKLALLSGSDIHARNRLALSGMNSMVRTVMYFAHANHQLEFDDLYDVGLDAVFESIEKFDPARSRFNLFVAVVVNRRLTDFASKRATYCRRSRRYALEYREGRRDGTQPEFSSFMNDVFLSLTPLEQTAVRMKFGLKGEAQIREALAATTGKQVVVRHLLNKAIKRLRGVKRLREAYVDLVT